MADLPYISVERLQNARYFTLMLRGRVELAVMRVVRVDASYAVFTFTFPDGPVAVTADGASTLWISNVSVRLPAIPGKEPSHAARRVMSASVLSALTVSRAYSPFSSERAELRSSSKIVHSLLPHSSVG